VETEESSQESEEADRESIPEATGRGNDYTCPECRGTGKVTIKTPFDPMIMDCYSCNGIGRLPDRRSHKDRRRMI
jgi:DnaJ-class molecular chaperone